MTDLPCCKLCNTAPHKYHDGMISCQNYNCSLLMTYFTEEQWGKLMYVPDKKTIRDDWDGYTFDLGYNAAIDAMHKGGEL